MDLNPIGVQKTTNKIVETEPEAPWKEIHEAHAFPFARSGVHLLARSTYRGLIRRGQETLRAQELEVRLLHRGPLPIALGFLYHPGFGGGGACGDLRLAHGVDES